MRGPRDKVREQMERLNRYETATWFQRNCLRPSMTAQAMPFRNGYRYMVHDVSNHDPGAPVMIGWSPDMGRAIRQVQAYFRKAVA